MPYCIECDEEFSEARFALGYQTCLECGEKHAKILIEKKKTRILPSYHKGGMTYVGPDDGTMKQHLHDLGKYARVKEPEPNHLFFNSDVEKPVRKRKPKPKFNAVIRENGELRLICTDKK